MRELRDFNPLTLISRRKTFLQFLGYAILAELYLPIRRVAYKKSRFPQYWFISICNTPSQTT